MMEINDAVKSPYSMRQMQLILNALYYKYYSTKGKNRVAYRTELGNLIKQISFDIQLAKEYGKVA